MCRLKSGDLDLETWIVKVERLFGAVGLKEMLDRTFGRL